jgi:Mn-dependent DtxR family transcriptional regulator
MNPKHRTKSPKSGAEKAIQRLISKWYTQGIYRGQYTLTDKGKRRIEKWKLENGR